MPRLLAVLLLAGITARAETTIDLRQMEAPPNGTVIVEFQRTPDVHERFRRDLGALKQRLEQSASTRIRYEYRLAILGAAVDARPESIDAIRRLPYVRAVHANRTVTAYGTGTAQAAAATIDAAARVNAGSLPTRGEEIRIGVIDTGIDYTHPALGGTFGPGHKVAGGWDFANNDPDPVDDAGHGTHVAGIIAADSAEVAGVAPAATLFAYKVLDRRGVGSSDNVIAAIERSIDPNQDGNPADHLDVINLSLGSRGNADDLVSRAADNATAAGVIVVAAAGNAGVADSIGSPGTARTAITVGATDPSGSVAFFSSRGPSPRILGFKPDVMAPGASIPSTWLGGITTLLNGTSMAAPHVAGAAALLRKLHPEWTPADIKSALVTTAMAVNDAPLSRAAGQIDVARAAEATTFVDGTGISFGLAPAKSGTWEAVRTLTVTNRGTAVRTFDVAVMNVPAGATLTATPAALQLAAGESKSIELRLSLDAAASPFPTVPFHGGDIEFRGDGAFKLPWFFVRAARITVAYDDTATAILALSGPNTKLPWLYDEGKAEVFVTPDSQWDFLILAYEQLPYAVRMAFAENHVASGDTEIPLRRADTSEVVFDTRDKFGTRFDEQPQINLMRGVRFLYAKQPGLLVRIQFPDNIHKMFLSPVSPAFTMYFFDAYFDVQNGRAYNVQHPPLSGLAQSTTLSAGPATYKRMRVRFPPPKFGPNATYACHTTGVKTVASFVLSISGCSPVELGPAMTLEYFTTMESGDGVSGIDFDVGTTALGMLRGIDGAIVPVPWDYPSPSAYRISDGEEISLGTMPLYAFAFFGTAPNYYIGLPPGFAGPFCEWYRYVTADTPWAMYDAANAQVASGVYSNLATCDDPYVPCDPGPNPQPGGRYVATRDTLNVAGQPSRGEIEVRFGSNTADLIAPTLTTLRVLNAQGRIAERLERNGNASLFFAAGDFEYPPPEERKPGATKLGSTRELKREATRVSFRVHGTGNWVPLSPVHQGSDLGSVAALRRFPAGELYRADLGAVTRAGANAIDLRIEIEDVAGNRTTWTQSPAIVIGDPPPPPPAKRRSARS